VTATPSSPSTTTTTTTTSPRGLRRNTPSSEEQKEQKWNKQRQSVIRRLYGPENGEVRKHVRLLEEKSQRSQTGFLSDPDHKVPYLNHPYDKDSPNYVGRRNRNLQTDDCQDSGGCTSQTVVEDPYKPLRIKFFTQALDALRTAETAAKIDFIENKILPA
jgi:hypothetical protein